MAQKNTEKRNEILTVSYLLLSEETGKDVSYSQIADGAHISKSLLQYYFPKKQAITEALISEMLAVTFDYVSSRENAEVSGIQRIADMDLLFFDTVARDARLESLLTHGIVDVDFFEIWTNTAFPWIRSYCRDARVTLLKMRQAVCFAFSGSAQLFHRQDDFGLDYDFICDNCMRSLLAYIGKDDAETAAVLETSRAHQALFRTEELLDAFRSKLAWYAE